MRDFFINNPNSKVCILDNNFIEFCTRLNNSNISVIPIFQQYDIIFIPSWVYVEISDSQTRIDFLQMLIDNNININIINESSYDALANYEDLNLLHITQYSSRRFAQIRGYIKRNVIKNNPEDDIEYSFSQWIQMLYDNWPISGNEVINSVTNETRIQKKNAGEISIAILAYILSYYYPHLESITLLTYDKDCYDCIDYAKEKFEKDNNFKNRIYSSITFKSNDFLIYELVKRENYTKDYIISIIDSIRTDKRKIKYTRKRSDGSYEDKFTSIDNSSLINMIFDDDIHIIF